LRQLLYLFRAKKISAMATMAVNLPLPTGTEQLTPLLLKSPKRAAPNGGGFDLDGDWTAVVAIWKGANSKQLNPDRQAVAAARSTYEANQLRSGGDPGRMMSPAQQEALGKANAARTSLSPTREEIMEMANHEAHQNCEPLPFTGQDFSPATSKTTIPAWELQKDDSSIDAGAECKRITQALNEAHKSIGLLRGILYSQINTHGRDYLGFLRQVDAGVYSLYNIDDQVQQMGEDIDFISSLLIADVGEGDLAASTVDISAFPTKA
jgi:hypothetical protein